MECAAGHKSCKMVELHREHRFRNRLGTLVRFKCPICDRIVECFEPATQEGGQSRTITVIQSGHFEKTAGKKVR